MRSVDTNVLARWLLGDDSAQTQAALAVVAEPLWISPTVLLELGWVLSKAIGLPRDVVAGMLRQVINLETATLPHREAFAWAIDRYEQGGDWADMAHFAASGAEASVFVTFDRLLERKAGPDRPLPVETLRV